MKIQIVQVGKTKDRFMQEGIEEMTKRLSRFASVEFFNLKENTKAGSPKEKIVAEESLRITTMMPKNAYVIVLDERGKEMRSEEFAGVLGEIKDKGQNLVFVIGGAFGLSENLKKSCNLLLSLSKMTFTHQMVRYFLLEQIYRGFCILTGKEYHY